MAALTVSYDLKFVAEPHTNKIRCDRFEKDGTQVESIWYNRGGIHPAFGLVESLREYIPQWTEAVKELGW